MAKLNAVARAVAHSSAIVWRPYLITLPGNVPRSKYVHTKYDDFVLVVDYDGPKSVTNDAERVVREMYAFYAASLGPKFRLLYRDTLGIGWDEILHQRGVFVDFAFPKDEDAVRVTGQIQAMLPQPSKT